MSSKLLPLTVAGALLLLLPAPSSSLNYSVIESTGKFCPGRDSCVRGSGRGRRGPIEQDWKKRNCFCDDRCALYGDCCVDANAYQQTEQRENFKKFSCVNLKQYGDVYVAGGCPDDWDMPNIRSACENPEQVRRTNRIF